MNSIADQPQLVHYVPIGTTILSVSFCAVLLRRYLRRGRGAHLLWWAAGILCYGLGTAIESAITLLGNSPGLNKAWYIAGAILGGYPLAQGTVYLLLPRRTAHRLTLLTVPFIVLCSVLVILSPVATEALQVHRPGGRALAWSWVRAFTPLINGYAVAFLIGGAMLSAVRFAKQRETWHRAVGNSLIAFGAMLPGLGGGMAKAGLVEWLYLGEFVGLLFIWAGYVACTRPRPAPAQSRPMSDSTEPRWDGEVERAFAPSTVCPALSETQRP